MLTIDILTAPAATPNPGPRSCRDTLTRVRATAADRLSTATIRLSQTIPPAVQEQLDRLDTYCTLRPLHRAIARARLQVRAYAFDHEHRGTRLLAWAAALDALAHTLRTIPTRISPGADTDRIEHLANMAALLRATAETEAAAAAHLDQLCRPSLTLAGRITLLSQLATRLHPTLGQAVQVLRHLT